MKDKNSVLNKDLNLAFVYIFIFLVGILIVFFMTNYINSKVNEISYGTYNINE